MCLAVTQLGTYAVEYPGYGHASRGVSEPSEDAMYTAAELMLEHLTNPTESGGTPMSPPTHPTHPTPHTHTSTHTHLDARSSNLAM